MERPDFREWLDENRERFITFTLDEIADYAVVSGYSREDVDAWFYSTRYDRRCA